MTFSDLPPGWPALSLRDERLAADVVDLVVRDDEREGRCISLLLCDADGRMIQPVTVDGVDPTTDEGERRALFDAFFGHLGASLAAVVVAVGRPRGSVPDDEVRAWHESALRAAREGGVELLGTYLATRGGVSLLPLWDERALAS